MCGIIGVASERDISAALLEGLARLEYRGYDSAGIAVVKAAEELQHRRCVGQVEELQQLCLAQPISGHTGIAHTRWATHGVPSEANAHPLVSGNLAVVHNGIIENYQLLRAELQAAGYEFRSATDSEAIAHLIHHQLGRTNSTFIAAVRSVVSQLNGAFAFAVMNASAPGQIIAVRCGSPLVVGIGQAENFVASDAQALCGLAQQALFLEEGDLVNITADAVHIENEQACPVVRPGLVLASESRAHSLGQHQHYMHKEIFAQPDSIRATMGGRIQHGRVLSSAFGKSSIAPLGQVEAITLVACGSSYLAACTAKYWFEGLAGLPCEVDIASEYRYREQAIRPNTLFITLSQSGETADTIGAFKKAQNQGYLATLSICNVPMSTLGRLADIEFLLQAGVEVSVASTKAISAMLVAQLLLAVLLGRGKPHKLDESQLVAALRRLPDQIDQTLRLDDQLQACAQQIACRQHAFFIGRGSLFPIAQEGALKLKEVSYIHAEGYAAGELKHGPLALVNEGMPVIALATRDHLFDKLMSNLQEVQARGGDLYILADQSAVQVLQATFDCPVVGLPEVHPALTPILYLPPLQLLAYHVALCRGTSVDKPRNLAKAVTVE